MNHPSEASGMFLRALLGNSSTLFLGGGGDGGIDKAHAFKTGRSSY